MRDRVGRLFEVRAHTDNFSYARFREKNKTVGRRTIIDDNRSLIIGYLADHSINEGVASSIVRRVSLL